MPSAGQPGEGAGSRMAMQATVHLPGDGWGRGATFALVVPAAPPPRPPRRAAPPLCTTGATFDYGAAFVLPLLRPVQRLIQVALRATRGGSAQGWRCAGRAHGSRCGRAGRPPGCCTPGAGPPWSAPRLSGPHPGPGWLLLRRERRPACRSQPRGRGPRPTLPPRLPLPSSCRPWLRGPAAWTLGLRSKNGRVGARTPTRSGGTARTREEREG